MFVNFSMQRILPRILEIPNIGLVLFERSKKAKHLNVSVKPFSKIRVAIPKGVSFEQAANFIKAKENWIKKAIQQIEHRSIKYGQPQRIDKEKAEYYLLKRLDDLTAIHGFTYNKATIRNQKTRWGSCSGKNNINLNIQLMRLPDKLIDYVIFHELVHTLVKSHDPLFWKTLNKFVGNSRAVDKQLKKNILY